MLQPFSKRIDNCEVRTCGDNLFLDLPHTRAEIVAWVQDSCYTIADWHRDPEGFSLQFKGNRPFKAVDMNTFWGLATAGQEYLDDYQETLRSKDTQPQTQIREIPPTGILKDWVAKLGLRHQGVLLTAVRGCDTEARHGVSKLLTRAFRGEILHTHVADEARSSSFIEICDEKKLMERMEYVITSHDHLPHHFLMHLIHAAQIIGYCGPADRTGPWRTFYQRMCDKFHMRMETAQQLHDRLNADEETFAANQ